MIFFLATLLTDLLAKIRNPAQYSLSVQKHEPQYESVRVLFGGQKGWFVEEWEAVDDRIRGGKSHSSFSVVNPSSVQFTGHLDTKTLGNAGFASRVQFNTIHWGDLSGFDGIVLRGVKGDGKKYALNLRVGSIERGEMGNVKSGVEWKFILDTSSVDAASASSQESPQDPQQQQLLQLSHEYYVPFASFQPYYRGRKVPATDPLLDPITKLPLKPLTGSLDNVVSIGIMIQSFFGQQEGQFSLQLSGIDAVRLQKR